MPISTSAFGTISFEHNMEIAHRLYRQPGKCQQIHGHSMQITLHLMARFDIDPHGYATDAHGIQLEFGACKKAFRHHIDIQYDHHLLLNQDDPWSQPLRYVDRSIPALEEGHRLPGLVRVPGDPSTENLALWIAEDMARIMRCDVHVIIEETKTNAVSRNAEYAIPAEQDEDFVDNRCSPDCQHIFHPSDNHPIANPKA